jgi:hypothetical protein
MKKTTDPESGDPHDDLLPEYQFDYGKAKPNRFAGVIQRRRVAVLLDDDVAEVFVTTEAVNKALRAIIEAMPQTVRRRG